MSFAILQKWIAILLSLITTFSFSAAFHWKDSMKGHEFEIIAPTAKAEDDVRVMSFNVRCTDVNGVPSPLRHGIVAREILKIKPDSFGVQEATPVWMAALAALLPSYAYVGVDRDTGLSVGGVGEYSAVFYLREKYDLLDHGSFWLSDTPEKPSFGPDAGCRRVCTWALLQDKETEALYAHVNTHMDNASAAARELGANLICDFIKDQFAGTLPIVFTADMNTHEGRKPYQIMTAALKDARYAAADSVGGGTYHDCKPENPETLDYIMCSENVKVNAFRVVTDGIDNRFVSDHFPIYADVTLPPIMDSYAGHDFPLIAPEEKADGLTRIMSFNLRCEDVNGVPADQRREIVAEQIRQVQPDSFGVQEATAAWMQSLSKQLPEYGWVGLERDNGKAANKGGEACAVFYLKAKYKVLDHGDFWLSDTPDQPSIGPGAACKRICTWAKLKNIRTGAVYVHVNSHFDHVSEEARVLGGEIVNRYIEEHFADVPVVFTADMNTRERGEAYATMTQNLVNARYAAADSVGFGTFHACRPETHAEHYIDFVLCSEDIKVAAYRTVTAGINGRFVSDHFPIYADVVIPGGHEPIC
ncbi:MAG: endonuclease/exonuclease/phosphatase family protein [Clostridia bacterium]|nr:endonuclease/exonuclease/phosphatase family protein [Clostridia bacterium]